MYETETGEVEDELPLYLFRQDKARVWGFEFEGAAPLAQVGGFQIGADVTADMTRAKIDSGPYVPRIPPLRILGGIEANGERLDARAEVEWTDDQTRIAAFETRSEEHTSELQSLMRISYAVFCLKKQKQKDTPKTHI